jgi:hypothetical protein
MHQDMHITGNDPIYSETDDNIYSAKELFNHIFSVYSYSTWRPMLTEVYEKPAFG